VVLVLLMLVVGVVDVEMKMDVEGLAFNILLY
jgi:hypothetical protein